MSNAERVFLKQPEKKPSELALVKPAPVQENAKIIPFPQEPEEKSVELYGCIMQEVLDIEETYTEKQRRRYASFAGDGNKEKNLAEREEIVKNIINILPPEEARAEKEIVTDENAEEFILSVFNSQGNIYAKNQAIREWVNEGGRNNFLLVQKIVANEIKKQQAVNVQTIALLGEVWQAKETNNCTSNELLIALEFIASSPADLQNCLVALSEINNPVTNVAFHKLIDFLNAYLIGCQNDLYDEHINPNSLFFDNIRLLIDEKNKAKNYLISCHLNDIYETRQADYTEKRGKISGISGGASDATIYTFKKLTQAYDNRIKLGVNESFPSFNPVMEIAPSYFGMYSGGKISRIFSAKSENEQRKKRVEDFITANHPEDEYIYDEISKPLPPDSRFTDDTFKLERLNTISDFEKNLKEKGRKFFYDISRLNSQELHPYVVAELMNRNQEYLNEEVGIENESPEIPENEYLSKLFLGHTQYRVLTKNELQ